MPRRERTDGRCATLYVRGDLPEPAARRRDAVAARLEAVTRSGTLDAFDVVSWRKRVPETAEGERERTLLEAFRQWAADADATLAPGFGTRRCYAEATGNLRTEFVLPVLCLAVYEGEDLVEVAPRGTDDGVVTVGDCLDRLEREESDDGRERVASPVG